MLRFLSSFLCMLCVVYVTAEFSDLYLCSYGIEEDEALQTSDRSNMCMPLYTPDKPLDDITQIRRKRSSDQAAESWPVIRVHRGRELIKTIHMPASFTPRLGRRAQHVINLNAGSAFTPRLGRQVQNP